MSLRVNFTIILSFLESSKVGSTWTVDISFWLSCMPISLPMAHTNIGASCVFRRFGAMFLTTSLVLKWLVCSEICVGECFGYSKCIGFSIWFSVSFAVLL